jgi:methylamine dehydrogenase accessory protein MauD
MAITDIVTAFAIEPRGAIGDNLPPVEGWWLASYVALWILVAALSLAVVALARQVGTLHLRLGPRGALEMDEEGPPLGEAPPAVDLPGADGRTVTVGGPGSRQLVLFVSPDCPICREVLPSIPAAARASGVTPVVISDAEGEPGHIGFPAGTAAVTAPAVAADYRVPGTPYAVVLDALGVVRSKGTVNSLEQLEGLIDTAGRRSEELNGEVGHP